MKQYNFKSDNYCYRKVGRAITIWGAIEKVQYCYRNIGEMDNLRAPKINIAFWVHQYYIRRLYNQKSESYFSTTWES